jgi:hypothetical protein
MGFQRFDSGTHATILGRFNFVILADEIHNKIMVHNMRQYYTKTFPQDNDQKVKLLN